MNSVGLMAKGCGIRLKPRRPRFLSRTPCKIRKKPEAIEAIWGTFRRAGRGLSTALAIRIAHNSAARKLLKIGWLKIRCCADNFSFPHSNPGYVSPLDPLPVLPVYNRLSAHPRRRLFSPQSCLSFPDSCCKSAAHHRRRGRRISCISRLVSSRAASPSREKWKGSEFALDVRVRLRTSPSARWPWACNAGRSRMTEQDRSWLGHQRRLPAPLRRHIWVELLLAA